MESQLVSDLRAELEAARRQNEYMHKKFGVYRKATQVRLSELRLHKRILGRELIALRAKLGADGNEKAAAAQYETKNVRQLSTNDSEATLQRSNGEQIHAQDQHAHEMNVQWDSQSPLLDSEITVAIDNYDFADIDSYASEIAASIESDDGAPTTPSAVATAPIVSSLHHQHAKDEQRHQPNDDYQQQIPKNNDSSDTKQGPFLDPFQRDPTPSPSAPCGQSDEKSNPRSQTTSRKLSSKDARILRTRTLLRHASCCTAPDGTCSYSKHCADVKRALRHIRTDGCNDPNCQVKHCFTSRYVLTRWRRKKTDRSPDVEDCDKEEGPPRKRTRESRDEGVCFPVTNACS